MPRRAPLPNAQPPAAAAVAAAGAVICSPMSWNRAATLLPVLAEVSMYSMPLLQSRAQHA